MINFVHSKILPCLVAVKIQAANRNLNRHLNNLTEHGN